MQEKPPEKKTSPIRIDTIGEQIREKFGQAVGFAADCERSRQSAIVAALECGELLTRAKKIIGHGKWLKWLADNVRFGGEEIGEAKCERWMRLAKSAKGKDLSEFASVYKVELALGLRTEPKPKLKAIGTAEVSIFEAFFERCDRAVEQIAEVDIVSLTDGQRVELRAKLQPVVELIEKL